MFLALGRVVAMIEREAEYDCVALSLDGSSRSRLCFVPLAVAIFELPGIERLVVQFDHGEMSS